MPLRHFYKMFFINPEALEESDFLTVAKKKMGIKLFTMAERIFKEFIETRDESKSGGYFQFAHVVGENGKATKHDVDYLWKRMIEIYGSSEVSIDMIKRVLGTICMLCVARDPRTWAYKDDMDKKEKLANYEIPEAAEYFIGHYKIPKFMKQMSQEELFEQEIERLKRKFKGEIG